MAYLRMEKQTTSLIRASVPEQVLAATKIVVMKRVGSLIGVLVTKEPFVTGHFCNLSPAALRRGGFTASRPSCVAMSHCRRGNCRHQTFFGRRLGLPPNAVLINESPRQGSNRLDGQSEPL